MEGLNLSNSLSEQAIIGSVLLRPSALSEIRTDLSPEHFGSGKFRTIYEAMLGIVDQGESLELPILANELQNAGKLEKVGGVGFLGNIIDRIHTSAGISYHVKVLRECAIRRKLADLACTIQDNLRAQISVEEILGGIREMVLNVKNDSKAKVVPLKQALGETIQQIEKLSKVNGNIIGVPSGFSKIDRITGGWQPGEFIIIAGRPGMGKSIMAKEFAEAARVPVAFFSLEMSRIELVKRQLSGRSKVNFEAVRTGRVNDQDWEALIEGAEKLADIPISYIDTGAITIDELVGLSENLKMTEDVGLVVIDYLQLIRSRARLEAREREVSEISRKLKALARNLEIPVICLAQLNRQCEMRGKNKRPILSDLRESGSLEQDSDIVMFLYREVVYSRDAPKNEAELIIAKGRNIRTGHIKLYFDGSLQIFRSAYEHNNG